MGVISGRADEVRSKLDKALDRPLTLNERRFAGDALAALERERDTLRAAVDRLRAGAVGYEKNVSVNRDAYAALIALAGSVRDEQAGSAPATPEARDPDPSSFGGHPYTATERALGYGTDRDPRFPSGGGGE